MFYSWETVEKSQVLNLLKQLKAFFSSPDIWIYWPIATDKFGNAVLPLATNAYHFNLMGACEKITNELYTEPLSSSVGCATREYLNDLSDEKLIHGLLSYEDELTIIELAIEDLEKELP